MLTSSPSVGSESPKPSSEDVFVLLQMLAARIAADVVILTSSRRSNFVLCLDDTQCPHIHIGSVS